MTNPCHHMDTGAEKEPARPRCKSGPACPWFGAYAARLVERILASTNGVERSVPPDIEREALAFVQEARVQKGASA